ncbi:DNA polymerase [Pseudomonas duriflava]|uniref:Type-4 uracil-DNA glycosylase n=1 Tax=Pseudomonas duriflava TaxID=459528 RepID=A0A562QQP1_9PSED|nr:UdgX family uracil-DNA binding protein [Pseudomonas duriflava]TWI58396.1 DNA polymerase [Pseudomonas duriflava]
MHSVVFDGTFAGWRACARQLLEQAVPPEKINWHDSVGSSDLFAQAEPSLAEKSTYTIRVPRQLADLLASAVCFRSDDRWALLYRILWRVVQGDPSAMLAGDEDGSELHRRIKAVHREVHHLHAFLRFRPYERNALPAYVAWHEPAHDVLELAAPHFCDRMGNLSWLIATPDAAALWDGKSLRFERPCPDALKAIAQQQRDEGDSLWQAYYASTFNPARVNSRALANHMPRRFWKDLPEGPLIPTLLSDARIGAQQLAQAEAVGAQAGKTVLIAAERAQPKREPVTALDECRRCELWQQATQAVPGEGPVTARIMLIGEQPGDQEDLAGRPFIGPAGQVLDRALNEAGLDRHALYLTNAVKHFKWTPQGLRRKHVTPDKEIAACRPWLLQELADVRPEIIVALGATAFEALLGYRPEALANYKARPLPLEGGWLIVTYHPSYPLRIQEAAQREAAFQEIVSTLRQARELLEPDKYREKQT